MAIRPAVMWMGKIYPPVWYDKELEPAELFALLAEMGIEGIDVFARAVDQYGVDTLSSALKSSGLECSCYYISANLVPEDPEVAQTADDAFTRGIENAQALGSELCFTHGSQGAERTEENFERYMDRLAEKLQLFAQTDMTLLIENSGQLMHTGDDLVRAAERLGDEGLRLCPDTGNFTLWDVDVLDAVNKCMPWTAHIHIKDYTEEHDDDGTVRDVEVPLSTGDTPVAEVFEILHGEGWSGWAPWEPGPQDEQGVIDSVEELLRLIG